MVRSVWQADTVLPEHSSLQGDARADVLVIGGGLAGLLTAWELREAGVDVLLLERSRICSNTTAHTTAAMGPGFQRRGRFWTIRRMGTWAGEFVIGDELRPLNGMKYCFRNMKYPADMK